MILFVEFLCIEYFYKILLSFITYYLYLFLEVSLFYVKSIKLLKAKLFELIFHRLLLLNLYII